MAFDLSDEFHSIRKLDDVDVKVLEQRVVAFTSPQRVRARYRPGCAARDGDAWTGLPGFPRSRSRSGRGSEPVVSHYQSTSPNWLAETWGHSGDSRCRAALIVGMRRRPAPRG